MTAAIRYLRHEDIDPDKWDACVRNASNGLIYGYSFYLDHMADHWDGLVLGDYEAVLALPWRKKYGIHYLYQPAFTVSSGVYGNNLSKEIIDQFIHAIPAKFKLVEINLNAKNILDEPSAFPKLLVNYTLQLQLPYEQIYRNYRQHLKRNIKRATDAGCVVKTDIPVRDVITLTNLYLGSVITIQERDLLKFEELYELLHEQGLAITYGVFSSGDELLASCVFFFSNDRAYYILVGNHPFGKTVGASHYLIDRFIADHAGENLVLDFEGSDIKSLAFFYESFGAKIEYIPVIRINRLPWYARLFK